MPTWNDRWGGARRGAAHGRPHKGSPPGQSVDAMASPVSQGGHTGFRWSGSQGTQPWRQPPRRRHGSGAGRYIQSPLPSPAGIGPSAQPLRTLRGTDQPPPRRRDQLGTGPSATRWPRGRRSPRSRGQSASSLDDGNSKRGQRQGSPATPFCRPSEGIRYQLWSVPWTQKTAAGCAGTYEAGGVDQERLNTLPFSVNVEVAVQLLLRDRPDQLAPEARGFIHPSGSHADAINAVQGPQPSPHSPRRRPPAPCPTL